MTRRAHKPTEKTRAEVQAYATVGVPHHQITKLIGLGDTATLLKYYRHELDLGKAKACAQVAKTLFAQAVSGRNNAAMIFWCKSQMGWSERTQLEISGPNGAPITTQTLPADTSDPVEAARLYQAFIQGKTDANGA